MDAQSSPSDAKAPVGSKQQSAGERTELAAERTVLASERTYGAWVRTGLAALVSGLAALRFMKEALSSWAVAAIAITLLVFAAFSFIAGAWRYISTRRRLKEAELPQVKAWLVVVMNSLLVAAAAAGIAGAFVLR